MSRHTDGKQFGPSDRIAAFAKETEVYAEGLEDPDLANVYWGKSLGTVGSQPAVVTGGGSR